jgi:hypothetical protein
LSQITCEISDYLQRAACSHGLPRGRAVTCAGLLDAPRCRLSSALTLVAKKSAVRALDTIARKCPNFNRDFDVSSYFIRAFLKAWVPKTRAQQTEGAPLSHPRTPPGSKVNEQCVHFTTRAGLVAAHRGSLDPLTVRAHSHGDFVRMPFPLAHLSTWDKCVTTTHKVIARSPWVLCILPRGGRLFETSLRSGKACE